MMGESLPKYPAAGSRDSLVRRPRSDQLCSVFPRAVMWKASGRSHAAMRRGLRPARHRRARSASASSQRHQGLDHGGS